MDITWTYDHRITVPVPRKPKKITGTRFASILNKNVWKSPFAAWCEITRTYEEPFEDTIYTKAGKIIEPKQAQYIRDVYGVPIISPTDVYGPDYFKKTYGDFFPEDKIFGGMWDYLSKDSDGFYDAVFEMKTTKRAEDWKDDVPDYYALQAALYAHLLGVDQVYMVCSFLEDSDYTNPEAYVPSKDNTVVIPFKVSERYKDFDSFVLEAVDWWDYLVMKGISPQYDEKRDADILSALRTHSLSPDTDIQGLIQKAETLKDEIEKITSAASDMEKELKKVAAVIKEYMTDQMTEDSDKVILRGRYEWTLTRSTRRDIDREAMERDGILTKYMTVENTTYKLTANAVK